MLSADSRLVPSGVGQVSPRKRDVVPGRKPGEQAKAGPAAGTAQNSDSIFESDTTQVFALCVPTRSQL